MLLHREKIVRWLCEEEKERTTNLGKTIGLYIVFSLVLTVIGAEPIARGAYSSLLKKLDIAIVILFMIEQIASL